MKWFLSLFFLLVLEFLNVGFAHSYTLKNTTRDCRGQCSFGSVPLYTRITTFITVNYVPKSIFPNHTHKISSNTVTHLTSCGCGSLLVAPTANVNDLNCPWLKETQKPLLFTEIILSGLRPIYDNLLMVSYSYWQQLESRRT
jgi:hypothetical protein